MPDSILALDFDGVICDSARECLVSSYAAFAAAKGLEFVPELAQVPERFRLEFFRIRPFVRDGEDYLKSLYFIDRELSIQSQEDFDGGASELLAEISAFYGVEGDRELEAHFQRSRTLVRERDDGAWMDMNPLYRGMADALAVRQSDLDSVYVTTSKPTGPASAILKHNGAGIPEERVLGKDKVTKTTGKNGHMARVKELTAVPWERIHLVDDQVSHLKAASALGVKCYLASWGYNTPQQWKEAKAEGIEVLQQNDLSSWMERVVGR